MSARSGVVHQGRYEVEMPSTSLRFLEPASGFHGHALFSQAPKQALLVLNRFVYQRDIIHRSTPGQQTGPGDCPVLNLRLLHGDRDRCVYVSRIDDFEAERTAPKAARQLSL